MSKERITISINKSVLDWIDNHVEYHVFANRSHGFEFLIAVRMQEEKKK